MPLQAESVSTGANLFVIWQAELLFQEILAAAPRQFAQRPHRRLRKARPDRAASFIVIDSARIASNVQRRPGSCSSAGIEFKISQSKKLMAPTE
jgi:hypothetical protein